MDNIFQHLHLPTDTNNDVVIATSLIGGIFFIIVIGNIYLSYKKKQNKFKLFFHLLEEKGFSKKEAKKIFNYLYKRDIEPTLIFEKEAIAEEVCKKLKMDCEELKTKLGFDRGSLIHSFIERQKELRKKWNR